MRGYCPGPPDYDLNSDIHISRHDTFELWRILTIRYYKDGRDPGRFRRAFYEIGCPLDLFVLELGKLSCNAPFLTFLTVTDAHCPAQNYLPLCNLPNLAVLVLYETRSRGNSDGFNDRVLKAWNETAATREIFPSLRAFHVAGYGKRQETLLAYLEPCRKLSLCVIPSPRARRASAAPCKRIRSWKQVTEYVSSRVHLLIRSF